AGKLVWNRVRMVKDPSTGKRISRVNPESEWQEQDASHLAIVDAETFVAAQDRRGERVTLPPRDRARPRHLLSGLLRCGSCGAGMSVKDRHRGRIRIRCTQAQEARSCENGRAYQLDGIEAAVVGGLRERMADRPAIELYVR
ncbi:recombinase zinc beta ribbon domain-containing protein, partial [Lysobacter sp. TAB13]|uniref:recombinase zinc beta ribbon domain-containing protein n=1 Tax=Lysobacter sp. TAB13 TaxID=3233065 RepID=UPI003F959C8C